MAERNALVPAPRDDLGSGATAIVAVFRQPPLHQAGPGRGAVSAGNNEGAIGAHGDAVDLPCRAFPGRAVAASPRSARIAYLPGGRRAAARARPATGAPAPRGLAGSGGADPADLQVLPPKDVVVNAGTGPGGRPRPGCSRASSVADWASASVGDGSVGDSGGSGSAPGGSNCRDAAGGFLEATFEGRRLVTRNPDGAMRAVAEARHALDPNDKSNNRRHDSPSFQRKMLDLVNDRIEEVSGPGDRLRRATVVLL